MKNLENTIYNFLKSSCRIDASYGIGCSGGGDSKALLYLLVKSFARFRIDLHVLHMDHAWREESKKEADLLEDEVKELNLAFHRYTLEKSAKKSNLEDQARNERLLFFSNIAKKLNLNGIFLAHHADDLAETVLKRVLEGAQLENLVGMKPVSYNLDTTIFRPLLKVEKKELKSFLENNKINVIDDPTNYDHKFLRARMRESLIPSIEEKFGKSIKSNLVELSFRSHLLHSYLDERFKKKIVPYIKGPFGCLYDFCKFELLHLIERNYLLKKIFNSEELQINRETFAKVQNYLELKAANKKFIFKEKVVICDRGAIFFIKNCELTHERPVFSIQKTNNFKAPKIGWKSFWKGAFYCPIPNEDVDVKWFKDLNEMDKRGLLNYWEKVKVPAFLKRKAPILCQNGKIIQDLLNSKVMCEGLPTCFFEWKIII